MEPTALLIPAACPTFEIHLLLSYIPDQLSFQKALLPLLHSSGPRPEGQLCPYSAPPRCYSDAGVPNFSLPGLGFGAHLDTE